MKWPSHCLRTLCPPFCFVPHSLVAYMPVLCSSRWSLTAVFLLLVSLGPRPCSTLVLLPGQPHRGTGREPGNYCLWWLQVRHPERPRQPWYFFFFFLENYSETSLACRKVKPFHKCQRRVLYFEVESNALPKVNEWVKFIYITCHQLFEKGRLK